MEGQWNEKREDECEMCDLPFAVDRDTLATDPLKRHLQENKMALYRHYNGHQPWPELTLDLDKPGQVPGTVHYLWCKEAHLGFHHYLGILSAIRHLQPLKIVVHFHQLPLLDHDMYYTWFLELKQSFPGLVLRPLSSDAPKCWSRDMLLHALSFLEQDGGVLLGSNVIISRLPRDIHKRTFWFAFSPPPVDTNHTDFTRGVVIARDGFDEQKKLDYAQTILQTKPACVTPEQFDAHEPDSASNAHCVHFNDKPDIYPVGIMYTNSSFGQLARWLFYGTRSPMHPKTELGDPIPRITHLIWFSPSSEPYQMEFYQFLTVLSALYVGGFYHAYIHGNAGFRGPWWSRLEKENVTFVFMDMPEMVYQQRVLIPSHQSDVTRYAILHKYGGAYQDFEAMWTSRVPDWLLAYPCVATSDWVAYGDFPDGINPGVLMAKRHAPWLRYNLAAHRFYIEENFVWNAVLMSYRTYERHPDQLLYYRHLQVMCDYGICHPSWEPGFRRDIDDRRPTKPFDWRKDTLVVHVTRPDPEMSFTSPETLKTGKDIYAEIGRNILMQSKRLHLLNRRGQLFE
ncbi:hypothetical protein V1264_008128 [Littorina saxatilis]|uniref:Uncharacterized protein n=1 Tax=Littorina saxatilis TaxID=31220 RepID=A0AAN9ASL3_9CAEN